MVNEADVEEAIRLVDVSRASIDIHLAAAAAGLGKGSDSRSTLADPLTRCLSLIRDLAAVYEGPEGSGLTSTESIRVLPMSMVRERVKASGFSDEHLQQCLVTFDQCNIWSISEDGTLLSIFN